MPTQGNPFTDDDLQRPSHEGRSLHDEVSNFFRGKLEISSPITASNLPKSSKVAEAFKMVLNDESDERFTRLLLDLQATKLNDLWPATYQGGSSLACSTLTAPQATSRSQRHQQHATNRIIKHQKRRLNERIKRMERSRV